MCVDRAGYFRQTAHTSGGRSSVDTALFQQLNGIYAPLHGRARRLAGSLLQRGVEASWGWYANHSVQVEGEYQTEEFPIPVVEAGALCEIGLDLDGCWLEFQLSREAALAFGWEQLPEDAQVYGVEHYLTDFYTAGMDKAGIAGRIGRSTEQAVSVALPFPPDAEDEALLSAVEDCRRWKRAGG